jgi:hypothetical protein
VNASRAIRSSSTATTRTIAALIEMLQMKKIDLARLEWARNKA